MMPRFAVLRHDSPRGLHWDLMLEMGDSLATWALAEEPHRGTSCRADALADHRAAYLDYEGPVSGGRGQVTCWDRGLYAIQRQLPTELALTMTGQRLQGRVTLTRSAEDPIAWQFCWEQEVGER